jgi:hypothetical protein
LFFCSISEIIDSDLPTPVFDNRTGRKLDVFNITIDEIKDVLLNLKLGKAVGIICRIGFDTRFKQSNNYSRFPHMWEFTSL